MSDITIITPVSPQHSRYLGDTWDSLKDQPGDWAWAVMVDGPGEVPVLDKITDPRVTVYHSGPHIGTGSARNHLAALCTDTILLRNLDADDTMLPGGIEKAASNVLDNGVDFGLSGSLDVHMESEHTTRFGGEFTEEGILPVGWWCDQWTQRRHLDVRANTACIRRDAWFAAGGYWGLQRGQDVFFLAELSERGTGWFDSDPQSTYRIWEDSVTGGGSTRGAEITEEVWRQYMLARRG